MRKPETYVFTVDEVAKALMKFIARPIDDNREDSILSINPTHVLRSMKDNEELIEIELLEKKNNGQD